MDRSITRIIDLLPHLESHCKKKGDLFAYPVEGQWILWPTLKYLRYAKALGYVFQTLNFPRGARVITIMGNRPEWNCIDMGLMLAGLIHVPVYPTLSQSTLAQIIKDASPTMMIIEDPELASTLSLACAEKEMSTDIYVMHASGGIRHFNELLDTGLKHYDGTEHDSWRMVQPDDIATIIYTSGTTGSPKGVMLSHANILTNMKAIAPLSGFNTKHLAMSFLPLCHIYERTLNYMYQYLGLSVWYATPLPRTGELMRKVKPHVFCAVPRFLEKATHKMMDYGYSRRSLGRHVFLMAIKHAQGFEAHGHNHVWYRFRLWLLRGLVFRKWKKMMGGRVKIIVSGSAALQPSIARLFRAAGIMVLEGYGLTETSPVIAVNRCERGMHKIGTVGPILDNIQVTLTDDGEILCKGPSVMIGYWQNPDLTREVIDDDGWFHTGDIGVWDEGRFLRIIDRKKELIKTSGGKYISPQQIEALFNQSPLFDQTMVVGEGRNFPIAIVCPDFNHLLSWCKNNQIKVTSPREILSHKQVIKMLLVETEKANQQLGRFEMIKKFLFVTETWDSSTGELSPTMKLRRKTLLDRYGKVIEELYEE